MSNKKPSYLKIVLLNFIAFSMGETGIVVDVMKIMPGQIHIVRNRSIGGRLRGNSLGARQRPKATPAMVTKWAEKRIITRKLVYFFRRSRCSNFLLPSWHCA
jgi:hypothetical protein